jgi:hypothetical protein
MYSAKRQWVNPATKSDGPDTSPDAIRRAPGSS